jgi:hypothetical protein
MFCMSRRRLVISLAVLPLILLVGLRSAWATYLCRGDGTVRTHCCCPERPQDLPDTQPRLAAADCCDLRVAEPASVPVIRESEPPTRDQAPAILVPQVPPIAAARDVVVPGQRGLARPPPTIPTFLVNRTILR